MVPPDPFEPGSRIGQYELLREIGRGGMGRVFVAKDVAVGGRLVALKVILTNKVGAAALARFRREISNLSRLRHPNIVTIFTAGEHHDYPYFVMDYIPGRDLGQLLDVSAPLGERARIARLTRIISQVARAIEHSHRRGVIHRDLKLSNILVSEDDTASVLDFGIAKHLDDTSLTHGPESPGTPAYRAPEQIDVRLKTRDELIDVWALGVVLYRSIARTHPFKGDDQLSLARDILDSEPTPLSRLNPHVPASLERLVFACLEKQPDARPGSAGRVADMLDLVVHEESFRDDSDTEPMSEGPRPPALPSERIEPHANATTVDPGSIAPLAGLEPASNGTTTHSKSSSKRRRRIVLGGLAALLIAAIGTSVVTIGPLSREARRREFRSDTVRRCQAGDATACTLAGTDYRDEGNFSQALASFLLGKAGGDAHANMYLGRMYELGQGVDEDTKRAADFYRVGCDGNDSSSCYFLGEAYDAGTGVKKDRRSAVAAFTKGCELGHGSSCEAAGIVKKASPQ